MFSPDIFDHDFAKNLKTLSRPFQTTVCPEHEIEPMPIKARAEGKQPFIILQFRPALGLQLYFRFARCPYVVRNLSYSSIETAGPLPVLMDGHFILPEGDALAYLREHYPADLDLDAKLPGGKRAQVEAFTALVHDKLAPALRASRYRDDRNYSQNVRAVILRATRFPLGSSISQAERRRGLEEQRCRGLMDGNIGLGEVLARADRAYRELDNWLGASTGDYFFGRAPTSFDACLFGHLVEAMADINLLVILTTRSNLMFFFRRIADGYFNMSSASDSIQQLQHHHYHQELQQGFAVPSELAAFYRRADYINRQNVFNQVENAKLCTEAPLVPEPMVHKFLEEREGPKGDFKGSSSSTCKDAADVSKSKKAEMEEERERHRENMLWLKIVGGVTLVFFLIQGVIAMVSGLEDVDAGDNEEGEGG